MLVEQVLIEYGVEVELHPLTTFEREELLDAKERQGAKFRSK